MTPQSPNSQSSGPTGVRIAQRGAATIVTLDRPAKLNAIDAKMRIALAAALPGIARDPNSYGIVIRASTGRTFCAGGDIRELYDQVQRNPAEAIANLGAEYALVWDFECYSKPTVALIDGAVMGSGVGLTLFGTHRVAGAGYRLRMPETGIGFFPDVGVAYAFARMPHEIGTYLGLTGRAIGRADAHRLRLTTHCIDADQFDAIEAALADADPVDPPLDDRHRDPGPAPIDAVAETIARCFSAPTVEEIDARLAAEPRRTDWCGEVRAELARRSPLALKVTLRHIRQARDLDLRHTLMIDHRIAGRLIAAPDFSAAVRAMLIDKSGPPHWHPARLEDVTDAMVDRVFAVLPSGGLALPTMAEMQTVRG